MPEPSLAMTMDDDLPRTVRRERDARERAARESRERERDIPTMAAHAPAGPMPMHAVRDDRDDYDLPAPAATVTGFDIPFARLMMFLIKVVVAGIPAIILLTAILWGFGAVMKSLFPWLVHTQITIAVPR